NLTCGINAPNYAVGYQMARTGNAYMGIFCYESPCGMEYIETKLDSTLIFNVEYCVEFYVSLANSYYYGIDKIGAFFSNDTIKGVSLCKLPYVPQIENPTGNVIMDTSNWIKISGSFIASGNERFMTIGCFHDNANLTRD